MGGTEMAIKQLTRWSAVAFVLSALAGLTATLLGPSDFTVNAVRNSVWMPMHTLQFVSYMLFAFALIGIFVRQADSAGRLGEVGFLLSFFSTIVLTAQVAVSAWILPVVAKQPGAPNTAFALLDTTGPLPDFSMVVLVAYLVAAIGFVLFGIAIMRAGVLPRWAGALLIIATVLDAAILVGPSAQLILKLGDLTFDLWKLGMAYALMSATGVMVMRPKAAT
jgi:hypothetical protein